MSLLDFWDSFSSPNRIVLIVEVHMFIHFSYYMAQIFRFTIFTVFKISCMRKLLKWSYSKLKTRLSDKIKDKDSYYMVFERVAASGCQIITGKMWEKKKEDGRYLTDQLKSLSMVAEDRFVYSMRGDFLASPLRPLEGLSKMTKKTKKNKQLFRSHIAVETVAAIFRREKV